jgi:2,4-dienoyl-CoA reductase-like NADH-dependent reductase (Old Yellow Enzyme family)/thioredoxin reductase
MNLIRSLMGRRQFLIAATAASTSALAYKNITGAVGPVFQTSTAMAADKKGSADLKAVSNRYKHLLSPLKIRNVIVKNRMIHTPSTPHFLQGPETYPADALRAYYATVAKSAAMVYVRLETMGSMASRKEALSDSAHTPIFDTSDPAVNNYIDQMVEGVHCMGSLVISTLGGGKDVVTQAKQIEDKGVDVVIMGGDIRNKDNMRAVIEQMQAVQKATDLIIMMSLRVEDPFWPPEMTDPGAPTAYIMDDLVAAVKMVEGSADIFQFDTEGLSAEHPVGWYQEKGKPWAMRYSETLRAAGSKILLAPRGGFLDPDENEQFISSGKCDMISMARAYICDSEYGKKILEGRGEDVVPCIQCNKCHMITQVKEGHWFSVCSVNPKLGLDSAVKVIDPPTFSKKVAIIGGGPGGMKAAIVAAERGHKVTLYEKSEFLGGLLRHAEFDPYKWAHKDYKDYLIRQIKKAGVEVLLNTAATPDMINAKGYDTVMVAVGSEPVMSRIPGADGTGVYNVATVIGKEKSLGKNVVVISNGNYGTETAMRLTKLGKNVTILTGEKLLYWMDRVHYPEIVQQTFDALTGHNFNYIMEVTVRNISDGKVDYVDAKGNEKSIRADNVVIYDGLKPKQDEALKFYGSARNAFFTLGDCTGKCGNIQTVTRSAFFTASQV